MCKMCSFCSILIDLLQRNYVYIGYKVFINHNHNLSLTSTIVYCRRKNHLISTNGTKHFCILCFHLVYQISAGTCVAEVQKLQHSLLLNLFVSIWILSWSMLFWVPPVTLYVSNVDRTHCLPLSPLLQPLISECCLPAAFVVLFHST